MTAILLKESVSGVLRLTLNRPQARSALSIELMTALVEALRRAAADLETRVVVIAGAGPAFCAGHDLGELREGARREGLRDAVDGLAREIAGKSAFTVKIGKEAFYRQAELDLAGAYRYAAEIMTTNMLSQDAGEGIDAFLAKRAPVWHDR